MPIPTVQPQNSLQRSALDVIKSALRLIHALASGEEPSASEAQDALMILNDMIAGWNIQEQMIFTLGNYQEFNVTAGKQDYTLGTGGDFNAPRPDYIQRMGYVTLNNPAQPLELPIKMLTTEEWAEVPVKLISSTIALECYDDGNFPFRGLHFRYIPSVGAKVRIYAWNALSVFPDLTSPVSFPAGYSEAIRYNLAVRLAQEFTDNPPPVDVAAIANTSMANIKSINTSIIDLKCDPAVVVDPYRQRPFNWLTGESK